ncbi:MAG: ABC transporter permease [Bifidobacteriaceae bacterium]|jgi:putative ABC transport system permease protein|nr:ABC transporter permease [Bifidobacteriaceae bacterium]MCI1978124.1 ABC transporter permease [Bifidobacteriaceae bacterium]
MFVLKNAWKSVIRNKGRNILIAIIVAIIAAAATVGLAIRNAASDIEAEGLSSTAVTATISVDRSKLISQARSESSSDSSSDSQPDFESMRENLSQDNLSLSDYEKYAKASSVGVSTYYSENTSLDATDDFQPVETSDSSSDSSSSSSSSSSSDSDSSDSDSSSSSSDSGSDSDSSSSQQGPGGQGGGMIGMGSSGDFALTGFSSDTAVSNASNGSFTMVDGEVFGYDSASDGKIIISKALAEFNDLKVGDTVSVEKTIDDDTQTYKLTISGIYKNTSSSESAGGPMGGTSQDPDNAIYTSVSTLEKLGIDSEADNADDTGTQLNFTYVLGSDDDYKTFAQNVKTAGLSDTYTVSSPDVEAYESSLAPMKNLSSFTLTFLLIVLGVGAVILIVLNLFNVRERKYEVGVMTAIGVKKPKVALQFVVELLIVTMVGLGIGVVGGAAAAGPVSNQLLSSQVSSQQSEQTSQQQQFGRSANMGGAPGSSNSDSSDSTDSSGSSAAPSAPSAPNGSSNGAPGAATKATEYISSLNATVNLTVVGQLILIGLALTLVSSLVGIIFVMRYEPLQILAERS